jgi:ATP-dependent Lon protease
LTTLPSLQLKNIIIPSEIVDANDRILTSGFYAEMELEYNSDVAQQDSEQPFEIVTVSPFRYHNKKY